MVGVHLGLRAGADAGGAGVRAETGRVPGDDALVRVLHQEPGPDQHRQRLRQRHEGGPGHERQRDQPRRRRLDRRLRRRPDPITDYLN